MWLGPLLLIAAIMGLYRPALEYKFVWDDNLYVVQNPAVQNWSRALEAFTSPRTTWSSNAEYNLAAWRPIRNISYLADFTLYGLNPIGWHLTNIILHAFAAVLLLYLLRRLLALFWWRGTPGSDVSAPGELPPVVQWISVLAAAWWAVHPVQTEVVAWVKSRDDLLATPLMFAALLLALPKTTLPAGRPSNLALVSSLLLYIVALLSKENVVVMAGIYPLILVLLYGRRQLTDLRFLPRWATMLSAAFAVITVVFLAARDLILGRTAQAGHPGTPVETALTMASAFSRYVRLVLWPWPPTVQTADYDSFAVIRHWSHPGALTGLVLLCALGIIALATRRRAPLACLGILFFMVAMLPFANIIPMMQIMAERFLYIPTAGLALLLGACLAYATPSGSESAPAASKPAGQVPLLVTVAVIAALALQTHLRLPVWESERALFADTRKANPTSWRPADHYARILLREGETTAGLTASRDNLVRWPNDPDIVRTAALAYLLSGNEPAGQTLTDIAVRLQPGDFRASRTLQQWKQMQQNK